MAEQREPLLNQPVSDPARFYGSPAMGALTNDMEATTIGAEALKSKVLKSNGNGKLSVNDFLDAEKQVTRSYAINFSGSLADWESGSSRSPLTWGVNKKDLDIFRSKRHDPEAADSESRIGDLSKVILISARVLYKSNPTPVDVAVKITGLRGNKYGNSMSQRFPTRLYAGEKGRCDELAHVPDRFITTFPKLIKNYGHLTRASIEASLVPFPDEPVTLVPKNSVIASLIALNAENLNINMNRADLVDGRFYKVDNDIVSKCLDELDKNVLQKQPFVNMEEFEATLVRADGRSWLDLEGADMIDLKDVSLVREQQAARNNVKLELELTYVICDKDLQ